MEETVLITGASSGIGYELAKLFAKDKYNLVLIGRNEDKLKEISKELKQEGISVMLVCKDLSQSKAPEEIYSILKAKSIHIDVLVNNAGIQVYGEFHNSNLQQNLNMIQINLVSIIQLTRLLLPEMVKNGKGRILNIASTGSFGAGPLNSVYCATKSFLLSFSEAIAEELRNTGVSVTALCPGATETEFAERAGISDIRLFKYTLMIMDAKKVAQIGYLALSSGKSVVVAGLLNKITVLSFKFMPRKLVTKTIKYFMDRPQKMNCKLKCLFGVKS